MLIGKPSLKFLEEKIIKKIEIKNENIVLGPKIGGDASIVNLREKKVIALHTDPITGARKNIGYFSIIIPSNDIASIGAEPKFADVCILLPLGYKEENIEEIINEIIETAKKLNINILGGHTEVTKAVNWPVIVTTLIGEMYEGFEERFKKIEKIIQGNFEEDLLILQVKPIGIEATAILAHDFEKELLKKMKEEEIEEAKKMLYEISILNEARMLYKNNLILHAHDPTEGGIAAALKEVSYFLNVGMEVYEEKIIIEKLSKKIFEIFEIDPLKVISSGCLICIIEKENVEKINNFLNRLNVKNSIIGKITKEKNCNIIRKNKVEDLFKIEIEEELWKFI